MVTVNNGIITITESPRKFIVEENQPVLELYKSSLFGGWVEVGRTPVESVSNGLYHVSNQLGVSVVTLSEEVDDASTR